MLQRISRGILCWVAIAFSGPLCAQMSTIRTPFTGIGDSYYERSSINWNLRGRNFFSQFGGGLGKPLGIGDPGSGFRTGAGFSAGGFRGSLGFDFAQGSDRFSSVVAPSLTLTDGMPGFLFVGTWHPFVVGLTPVVSSGYYQPAPWSSDYVGLMQAQMYADAQQALVQQQMQQIAKQRADKAIEFLRRADEALAQGDAKKSRNFLYAAKKYADGALAEEVQRKLQQK